MERSELNFELAKLHYEVAKELEKQRKNREVQEYASSLMYPIEKQLVSIKENPELAGVFMPTVDAYLDDIMQKRDRYIKEHDLDFNVDKVTRKVAKEYQSLVRDFREQGNEFWDGTGVFHPTYERDYKRMLEILESKELPYPVKIVSAERMDKWQLSGEIVFATTAEMIPVLNDLMQGEDRDDELIGERRFKVIVPFFHDEGITPEDEKEWLALPPEQRHGLAHSIYEDRAYFYLEGDFLNPEWKEDPTAMFQYLMSSPMKDNTNHYMRAKNESGISIPVTPAYAATFVMESRQDQAETQKVRSSGPRVG